MKDQKKIQVAYALHDDTPVVTLFRAVRVASSFIESGSPEGSFDLFPNIVTPGDLAGCYEKLGQLPVPPQAAGGLLINIREPEVLLRAFGLKATRTALNRAKDLLARQASIEGFAAYISVAEALTISRDMKALLTVLLYCYGRCTERVLKLNTQSDFSFLYEFDGIDSPYGAFLQYVREEDPNVLEMEHFSIHEDIDTVVRHGRSATAAVRNMERFAESYLNSFMWTVHPALVKRRFVQMPRAYDLGSIYAYWAELASKDKAMACANCGKLVAHPRKDQIYCSNSCKVQASKKGLNKK